MPTAYAATGTLFQIGDGGGSESFTTIAGVKDIDGPKQSVDTVETTSHDANGFKTFIPTLKESGDISFDLNFVGTATQGYASGLYNDYQNRTRRNFRLIPPSLGVTYSLSGYVTNFEWKFPVADVISASITIKVDGAVTIA